MKNVFYFTLKALFVLETFIFVPTFGYIEKLFHKKLWLISKITAWTTNNYNTHIAQYLKK